MDINEKDFEGLDFNNPDDAQKILDIFLKSDVFQNTNKKEGGVTVEQGGIEYLVSKNDAPVIVYLKDLEKYLTEILDKNIRPLNFPEEIFHDLESILVEIMNLAIARAHEPRGLQKFQEHELKSHIEKLAVIVKKLKVSQFKQITSRLQKMPYVDTANAVSEILLKIKVDKEAKEYLGEELNGSESFYINALTALKEYLDSFRENISRVNSQNKAVSSPSITCQTVCFIQYYLGATGEGKAITNGNIDSIANVFGHKKGSILKFWKKVKDINYRTGPVVIKGRASGEIKECFEKCIEYLTEGRYSQSATLAKAEFEKHLSNN